MRKNISQEIKDKIFEVHEDYDISDIFYMTSQEIKIGREDVKNNSTKMNMEILDNMECMICLNIVRPAVKQCQECNKVFCNTCMLRVEDRSKCPACRQNKMGDLNRLVKVMFSFVEFTCPNCSETMGHEAYATHL